MRKELIVLMCAGLIAGCGGSGGPEQPGAQVEDRTGTTVGGGEIKTVTTDKVGVGNFPELTDPKSILAKRSVFFDYDQFVIKDEFKPLVEAHARFLVGHPKMKMLIQGHADERGSREYNLALGQKRAEALKKMLALLGAKEDQLESVSLGEEKPRCAEHAESCWSQNRRDDMLYTGEF